MRKKKHFPILTVFGILLLLAGLIGLYSGPEISQYVFLPDSGTGDYREKLAAAEERWEGAFPAISLHGTADQVSLTTSGRSQGEVTLYEVQEGYFEVYPRRFTAGRPLSRGDRGNRMIVLDDALSFALFGDQDPVGREIQIDEKKFEIAGVAEHRRGIGDTGAYTAWVPLGAEGLPACRTMVLSAGGKAGSSLQTLFESGARDAFGKGQAIYLHKERSRGTILLRAAVIVLAIRLLAVWIRLLVRWFSGWIGEIREKLKTRYPRQMPGTLLGRGAEMLLLTAATIGACIALVVWGTQPMLIFPEWVPEVLVSPEAVIQRFRELTAAAAAPLQFRTPELAEIRFWSGMIRWGLMTALLGYAIRRISFDQILANRKRK